MLWWYLSIFGLGFGVSFGVVPLIRRVAVYLKICDLPNETRKIHRKPIPLLGGVAIGISLALATIILWLLQFSRGSVFSGLDLSQIIFKHWLGVGLASLILIVGGVLDEKYTLSARTQFLFPLLAVLVVVASGIGIKQIQGFDLTTWRYLVLWWQGIPYYLTVWSDLFTVVWLLGVIYTTKLLDGLDGLVVGISLIASLFLFIISLILANLMVALFALLLAGVLAAFLIFNFYPATIFLGESGSTLVGFLLGVLAIIGQAKVSLVFLLFGIPIFDLGLVIIWRLWEKQSPFRGDNKHLHYRWLGAGLSHLKVVLVFYVVTFLSGLSGLLLQQHQPLAALGLVLVVFILVSWRFILKKSQGLAWLD